MKKEIKLTLLFFFGVFQVWAQKPLNPPTNRSPKSEIQIIYADSLVGEGQVNSFFGNVKFRHQGATLTCNKAILNSNSNSIVAFGKVKILQGDTLSISGDTLFYFGNERKAKIYGNKATLVDKDNSTLKSRQINYDLNEKLAYYPVPGEIEQDSTILKSDKGYYKTDLKTFRYFGNVSIQKPDFLLETDSLLYDSKTKWADLLSPIKITSKDGNLEAKKGRYNTETKESSFKGRSLVINEKYSLEADSLDFNQITENGLAFGNVLFTSFTDSLKIYGDKGIKQDSLISILGNAFFIQQENKDTLFLKSTNFYAFEDTKKQEKKEEKNFKNLIAQGKVAIFRHDFQSTSDSLNYNVLDSNMVLIGNPLFWSEENQLKGDSVKLFLKNNTLSKIDLIDNSFIISQDSVQNFNQIKGRKTEAYFNTNGELENVLVDGNGESIYFVLDEKNKLIGLNRVECSSIKILLTDNQVKKLGFMGKSESKFYPPIDFKEELLYLDNFFWDTQSRPQQKNFSVPY